MKRNLLYLVLCVNLLIGLTGCYEDKSTEATHFIPEIVIDTTGIGEMKTLKRFERLQINPKVSKEGTDPSNFSYKWMLSLNPIEAGKTPAYECIGEEMSLDAEITRDDNEKTYRLWFQVTDNTTELRKDMIWEVRVLAPYGEGLLIAEEVEGGTDLALIESKQFSDGYQDAPLIRHNIFSSSNEGKKINADLFKMSAFKEAHNLKYYILLGKGEDKYLLLDKTYKTKYRNEEGFVEYAVDNLNPTDFDVTGDAAYLVNDNQLHWMWLSTSNSPMQWGAPIPYQGEYVEVDKMLAAGVYNGPGYSLFYVPSAGCFKTLYNTTMRWDLAEVSKTAQGNWGFDPQNCPNLEMIYGGLAPDNRVCALMKNKEDGSYFIVGQQTKSGYKAGTISDIYIELPECELDNAIAFASHELGGVLYFATKHDIYAIVLNAVPVQVNKIHSFTDEITHMSIFRQARNTTDYYSATLEDSNQTILATTWNGSTGSVYAIPILNFYTGELDFSSHTKYEGFGKISTVIHQYP